MSRWIDENLDHRMILDRTDPAVPVLQELGEPMYLMDISPTAENIAKLIFDVAAEQGFPVVEVRLWETPRCCATYRALAFRKRLARISRRSNTSPERQQGPGTGCPRLRFGLALAMLWQHPNDLLKTVLL